jgi:hypothetical protein
VIRRVHLALISNVEHPIDWGAAFRQRETSFVLLGPHPSDTSSVVQADHQNQPLIQSLSPLSASFRTVQPASAHTISKSTVLVVLISVP